LKRDLEDDASKQGLAVVAKRGAEISMQEGYVDGAALEGKQGRILDMVALEVAQVPGQLGAERQGLARGRLPDLYSIGERADADGLTFDADFVRERGMIRSGASACSNTTARYGTDG
jgi:hypothetical protein